MDDQREKTDGTKETTEPTPNDIKAAEALIDEELIEEEPETKQPDETVLEVTVKEKMRLETRIALGAVILVLFSMLYLWMCSTTDKKSYLASTFFLGLATSFIASLAVARFVAWNKDKGDFLSIPVILLLWCISFLPLAIGIIPLSKYHNLNQIERDKKIVEILQISKEKDKIMIILPDEYYQEHKYLEKVLSVGWTNDKKNWEDIAIPCRRGNEYWYEATVDKLALDQTGKKASFILFFNHAWKDYQITKEVLLQP